MTRFTFAYLVVRVTILEWKWKSAVNDDGSLFFFFFLRDILILIQNFLSPFMVQIFFI